MRTFRVVLFAALIGALGCGKSPVGVEKFCKDANASNYGGSLPCVPKQLKTMDSMTVVLAPADSFDAAASDVYVDFGAGGQIYSVQITSWYADHKLAVPSGVGKGVLRIRGGAKYESRDYADIQSGQGLRYAKVLHPNCWLGRKGDITGQIVCLPSAELKADPGDGFTFYANWLNPPMVSGWQELLPAKLMLSQEYSPSEFESATLLVDATTKSIGEPVAVVVSQTAELVPVLGTILVKVSATKNSGDAYSFGPDGISSGIINLMRGQMQSLPHELMHTLGFGHFCARPTRMASAQCQEKRTVWFTADDIAAFQMAFGIRAQSKRINANLSWW